MSTIKPGRKQIAKQLQYNPLSQAHIQKISACDIVKFLQLYLKKVAFICLTNNNSQKPKMDRWGKEGFSKGNIRKCNYREPDFKKDLLEEEH